MDPSGKHDFSPLLVVANFDLVISALSLQRRRLLFTLLLRQLIDRACLVQVFRRGWFRIL
jgi:hypothetical protein